MSDDTFMLNQKDATEIIIAAFEHLADWPIRSTEAFRNAALGTGMLGINPMLEIHEEEQVNFLKGMLRRTIAQGNLIDFGFIPNELIKAESLRSREMFESGELLHPYDNWLAVSSWEGGFCGYLIGRHPDYPLATLVVELYGISFPTGDDLVLIYDIIAITAEGLGNTVVAPYDMSYPKNVEFTILKGTVQEDLQARGANSLDPLVTFLRLLADASVPIEYREPPEKLNKHRRRMGKFEIPGHTIVHTKDYVAGFSQPGRGKGGASGGTHASPIAHWRRSHWRHLRDGKVVSVRASKVNWRDGEEMHRLFYRLGKVKV